MNHSSLLEEYMIIKSQMKYGLRFVAIWNRLFTFVSLQYAVKITKDNMNSWWPPLRLYKEERINYCIVTGLRKLKKNSFRQLASEK